MANRTDGLYPCMKGNWKTTKLPIKASTAITANTALAPEKDTGVYTIAPAEVADGQFIRAIIVGDVAATDSDYAVNGKRKLCYVPMDDTAEFDFDVGAGTFTAADVNKTVELHTGRRSLAVDTKGKGAVITAYYSATKGRARFYVGDTETAA